MSGGRWQKDGGDQGWAHTFAGVETVYPARPSDPNLIGATTATAGNSYFVDEREGVLRTLTVNLATTVTVEDHDGNFMYEVSATATLSTSASGINLRFRNGIRFVSSGIGAFTATITPLTPVRRDTLGQTTT